MWGMPAAVVQASGLTRVFEARTAVDELSFSVHAGEVLALLGPNGAGKTTTFRMLAGLLMPTRGNATVAGTSLSPDTADAIRARVGLLTETAGLWERLTVRSNLHTYARLHGVADPAGRVTEVLEAVGLADRADDRAGALSRGLKQRAAIARAVVHDPSVVLLDEPTAGLDPANARDVRDLVRQLRAQGRAVLVSTHNLTEAEELADRIAVMNARLLACDTPRALRERRRGGQVVLEVEGDAAKWVSAVRAAGAGEPRVEGERLIAPVAADTVVPDLVAALVAAGARIRRVVPHEPSLEETYLDLVRRDA
jgi:ABC-2 type transport system ATP-binding protein